MHEALIKYINSYATTPLSESEMELIRNTFIPKKFRKRQYFLQEGEVCKYSAFIVKGAMRQYSVDEKGAEHIIRLSIENWWAVDRESFVMLTPSHYYIDAWEDTDALLITRAEMISLLNPIPALAELTRKLDERNSIANQRRVNASISLSAEKRYEELVDRYPEFLKRFPQHIIASYLGITDSSLSRIRKEFSKA